MAEPCERWFRGARVGFHDAHSTFTAYSTVARVTRARRRIAHTRRANASVHLDPRTLGSRAKEAQGLLENVCEHRDLRWP